MSESLKFIRKKNEAKSVPEDIEFQPAPQSEPDRKPGKKQQDRYLDFLEKIYDDVLESRLHQK